MDLIYGHWPWYVSGPLMALTMFALLFVGKQFGMSSNLRTVCAIAGAGKKVGFFNYDWKSHKWNLIVVAGSIIGGFIASNYLSDGSVAIAPETAKQLAEDYNILNAGDTYLPGKLFSIEALSDPFTLFLLIIGGVLVGFGARYAGGCTSGHAISGLSNLQLPSLIAVIGFFIGGLTMIHLIFPILF